MSKLQGKVAIITGGTTGIGFAAAKLFVKEGAHVFITGRRQKELDESVKVIGSNVTGIQGDVSKLTDLDRLYDTIKAKGKKIDIVFANAGVAEFAALGSITEEHFDRLFDINVKGTLFTVQKALPLMNDGGSIILTGSVASIKGTPAFWVYGATKAAIRNFVRAWTVELKDRQSLRPFGSRNVTTFRFFLFLLTDCRKLTLRRTCPGNAQIRTSDPAGPPGVWGTIPSSIGNVGKGGRVQFTAKVEPSAKDPKFGFYSRPTKAQMTIKQRRVVSGTKIPPSGNRLGCNDYRRLGAGVYGKTVRERVGPEPETERQKTAAALG